MNPFVINWHVTEACNYRCHYCYAQWEQLDRRDLIRDPVATRSLLAALFAHFGADAARPRPRLNFAGGEPLLRPRDLLAAMRAARECGFDVSLITNGSRLDEGLVDELAPGLQMLGISLDADDAPSMAAIGRQDARGRQVDLARLARLVARAREINPALAIKLNTVVCAANWQADLAPLVASFAPRRWKVLRMLPVLRDDLAVSDAQFQSFVARHQPLRDVMEVEDNDAMSGSYIMVDPSGRFFQNRAAGGGYEHSPPIVAAGAASAFASVQWSPVKFDGRYTAPARGGAA